MPVTFDDEFCDTEMLRFDLTSTDSLITGYTFLQ